MHFLHAIWHTEKRRSSIEAYTSSSLVKPFIWKKIYCQNVYCRFQFRADTMSRGKWNEKESVRSAHLFIILQLTKTDRLLLRN